MFFKFSSQITPGTIYHVDLGGSQPQVTVHLETKVHSFSKGYHDSGIRVLSRYMDSTIPITK